VANPFASLPPGSVPAVPGDVLAGKYRVDRILGVGGMGVVVAATHLQLGQKVALKFMLPEALRQHSLLERFAREARAAAGLKSDHVARVLDVGTLDTGSPYMVMEYLEGRDLGSYIEGHGRMPVAMAVDCVLQACDAVAEAHSLGIVHRDLKPRNLFMTTRNDGRALVKVLDFGISKHGPAADLSLTRTTDIIGSPNYMSPEQLRSAKNVDGRSDIWALGVILYELLSGQVPFVAESVTQLTAMVFTEAPRPIQSLRADVPPELARVIERCLEKPVDLRFASVAELAAALQPFAPADTRDLAVRIARIGTGTAPSLSRDGYITGTTSGATSGNWSESGRHESSAPPRRFAAVAIVSAVVGAGLLGATMLLRTRQPTATATATATTTATTTATATATTTATTTATPTTVTLTPPPTPSPASSLTPSPTLTPSSASSAKHAPHVKPATSSSDEPPQYRTNW
jgi:serine/threonine-protein kinase